MPDIWLATYAGCPDGCTDGRPIDRAFKDLDVDAQWAVWDDPDVDWAAAPLVAVRSIWDYQTRHAEFLGWAARVDAVTTLVNPLAVLRWNSHKGYLAELPALGVPTVPTYTVPAGAGPTMSAVEPLVVKPAVGASGVGVRILPRGEAVCGDDVDLVVQPLVESVRTEGERSVYVINGVPVAAAVKRPARGEIRVHEEYGGETLPDALTPETTELAVGALRAVEERFGVRLPYARADLMRLDDGAQVLSELELVEPGLYAEVLPSVPVAYAAGMAAVLQAAKKDRDAT
ncbi:MAG: hypothetical protein GEU96_05835 [Propionibacteriales bacterium]|nr:hypothetical protein [Propionibacteriales bacterium]